MKEISKKIEYKGKLYTMVFNLNVMEELQREYGTMQKWGELTDGANGNEIDAKAVIFGFNCMFNEGIDIDNEESGTELKPLTLKQTGRIITEIGLRKATEALNNTIIESTQSTEKNA